ncbi:MAG TPA: FtsX-like permease family protein [Alphaproteobacteria bacterium]|nr:FtsX-like permease family protein [Alphaproteobacteria bacterium]
MSFKVFAISSRGGAGYDVPLHLKLGTEFLVILTGLMTFLSLLAAIANLSLGHMTHAWTSGLENTLTIEIPAPNVSEESVSKLLDGLRKISGVEEAKLLSQKDMQDLLSPWLGDAGSIWDDLPVPKLVTVSFSERTPQLIKDISATTRKIIPDARVDAHEDWLADLMKLAHGLKLTALAVFILIMMVTAVVIAGAVRSRMAIHHRELELLHIMGASDRYITGQFVRYILMQSLKGSSLGAVAGLAVAGFFLFLARRNPGTVPELTLQGAEWLVFAAVPCLLIVIGLVSARITSLRVLGEMP